MAKQVAAAEFKVKCLRLLDEVERSREEIVITKRGRPVARLVPAEQKFNAIFGRMAGSAKILGDIIGPTGAWDEEQSKE